MTTQINNLQSLFREKILILMTSHTKKTNNNTIKSIHTHQYLKNTPFPTLSYKITLSKNQNNNSFISKTFKAILSKIKTKKDYQKLLLETKEKVSNFHVNQRHKDKNNQANSCSMKILVEVCLVPKKLNKTNNITTDLKTYKITGNF